MKTNPLRFALALGAGLLAAASSPGFSYITDQRKTGTALPLKWPAGTVAITLKLANNPAVGNGANFNSSAQASAQAWNAVIGDLQITSTIGTDTTAAQSNGVNELIFAADDFGTAFDTNVIAITTVWARGNERTQADIVFNSAITWGSYDGPRQGNPIDLKRVALHEMGHLLGLDHPDDAGQTVSAIMNSHVSNLDTLTSDDITGVQNLYGPPGTPGNDSFANAVAITLSGNNTATVTGFNTNATKQVGEPNHAGDAGGRSIWWKWTAPVAGSVSLDTRGSYLDTTLGVYTGSAVNSLSVVASNDDITSGVVQASSVSFTAAAGTTYFIAVDGFNGNSTGGADSGGITLNLSFTPSVPTPPVITTQPVNTTVTAGGTASFSVVASGAISFQWQFNGSNIAGATTATYSITSVLASQAGTYRVVVTNNSGSVNSADATLTVTTPAPPPPVTPPSSGGGGGGGGAPSLWFYGTLSLMALARFWRRR